MNTKKYDKSQIFKNAWQFVKKQGMSLSDALKKAWLNASCAMMDFTFSEPTTTVARKVTEEDKVYAAPYFKMRKYCFETGKTHLLNLSSNL